MDEIRTKLISNIMEGDIIRLRNVNRKHVEVVGQYIDLKWVLECIDEIFIINNK